MKKNILARLCILHILVIKVQLYRNNNDEEFS